ncbi:MAG: ATP-binding protein [bacterium]|nr:ATP-binding protein [bacterium]
MALTDLADTEQLSFSIFNTAMAVRSMRDSGYKSTAHALAELIDNSIEAGATTIELFGVSRRELVSERETSRLKELAVLDDGCGMTPDELRGSLRYGHGTRLARRGIGRFGVGLPNSSMSQARRVDVWSWQAGVTNASHARLWIDDVEAGQREIPEPSRKPLPDIYLKASQYGFSDSGTLVVWTDLDRVQWTRAATTFKNAEALIGRIYRRFLLPPGTRLHPDDDRDDEIGKQRIIVCVPVELDGTDTAPTVDADDILYVRPNDPLYLMSETSCPEDFGPGPMFEELAGSPFDVVIQHEDMEHTVRIRASYARPHVRMSEHPEATWPDQYAGSDAGHTPWGKHAASNVGVSLIRAHREIEIDKGWINHYDPVERWWKVEVDFPPALDDVFGVTNNKQGAMTFQRLADFVWDRESLPGEGSFREVRERMSLDGDPRVHLFDLRHQVEKARDAVRNKAKLAKQKRGPRHAQAAADDADRMATAEIKRRSTHGQIGSSDRAALTTSREDQRRIQVTSLVRHGISEQEARRHVTETLERGNKVRWIHAQQNNAAFFDVESQPGVIQVTFNASHPVFNDFYEIISPDVESLNTDDAVERLADGAAAFRLLLYAWARLEDELPDERKRVLRDLRNDWGRYAEDFFIIEEQAIAPTDRV